MKNVPTWLSHLQRDRRGLPIPYVNRYGEVSFDLMRLDHDRHAGRVALFMDDDPDAPVDFTKQHMARQRECMAEGRCQVCHSFIPWSRRFLVVAPESVDRVHVEGVGEMVVTHEPWLCGRCAEFATTHCPALIRRTRDESMVLVPVTSQRQVRFVHSYGVVDGPLEAESRRVKPTFWIKIQLPAAFLAEHGTAVTIEPVDHPEP